ncbi:MAG: hypothetical protein WB542_16250, partial [Polaromonas sp.]
DLNPVSRLLHYHFKEKQFPHSPKQTADPPSYALIKIETFDLSSQSRTIRAPNFAPQTKEGHVVRPTVALSIGRHERRSTGFLCSYG